MKSIKQISIISFLLAVSLFCFTPSISAWIIVLNGTSCTGKTTLARNLQKITQTQVEVLQIDTEADLLFKEAFEARGYHHDGTTCLHDWFDSLPEEVQREVANKNKEQTWITLQKRLIAKAQKFDLAGINVIIDTGLKDKTDYKLFSTELPSKHTYFVLLYASVRQLLKHLVARNASGESNEKRNPLEPFYQYFFLLAEQCEVTSPEKLDILTKEDFEFLFEQLEVLIKDVSESDDYWISTKDFTKLKSIIEHKFFHTCWSYTPYFFKNSMPWYWIKTWLPCYCGGRNAIGIKPQVSLHDFVINTGTSNPIECAKILSEWLAAKLNEQLK